MPTTKETPEEAWRAWQIYFKDEIYRPSESPHEDYYNQILIAGLSPQHVITLLRRAQLKDPSSTGFDLVQDFRTLYAYTKHKRVKGYQPSGKI